MLSNHDEVIQAIHDLREVRVTLVSRDGDGAQLTRRCAPMDYGPARRTKVPEEVVPGSVEFEMAALRARSPPRSRDSPVPSHSHAEDVPVVVELE